MRDHEVVCLGVCLSVVVISWVLWMRYIVVDLERPSKKRVHEGSEQDGAQRKRLALE